MAHLQSTIETRPVYETLLLPVAALGQFLTRLSEANVRVRELNRLNTLSDAELAKLGMKREDIVRHVFQGSL